MGVNTSFSTFNIINTIVPILMVCIFVAVIVIIVTTLVRKAKLNSKNNASPVLNVTATVTSKRTEVKGFHGSGAHHGHTRTYYFVTFEVESGDRIEFSVTGEQAGLFMEHDHGTLTFQGTRYLNFTRTKKDSL